MMSTSTRKAGGFTDVNSPVGGQIVPTGEIWSLSICSYRPKQALARYASTAKASAILRLPNPHRLATLIAFVHCLEATAQDDAIEVLEALLRDLFNSAVTADKKARLRTLKDLDKAAVTLVSACQILLDTNFPDAKLRTLLFERISRDTLTLAVDEVNSLVRPADDVYYHELGAKYKSVRRYLPALLEYVRFMANAEGQPIVAAFNWCSATITLAGSRQLS